MGEESIAFGDIEFEKNKFDRCKSPTLIGNKNINKIIVSHKTPFGKNDFKYFVAYKNLHHC